MTQHGFLNSNLKSSEIGKIGHRRSLEMGTWVHEMSTLFPGLSYRDRAKW